MDKDTLRQSIVEMDQAGAPPSEIANELECSVSTVYRILSELGVSRSRSKHSVLDDLTSENRADIIKRYVGGEPVINLITEFAINYNAFYRLLQEEGVSLVEIKSEEKKATDTRMEHAVQLYIKGAFLWQIEQETGIRQPQLHRELHMRGISLRQRRSR